MTSLIKKLEALADWLRLTPKFMLQFLIFLTTRATDVIYVWFDSLVSFYMQQTYEGVVCILSY